MSAKLAFLLLLGLLLSRAATSALAAQPALAGLEVFLDGEKPIIAKPSLPASDGLFRLHLARNETQTISVRLPAEAGGKLIALSRAELAGAPGVTLKSYVAGVHEFAKSSFRPVQAGRGAGEVPDILIPAELANEAGFKIPAANIPSKPIYVFDIRAKADAKPGTYDAKLTFSSRGELHALALKIRIHSTVLPETFQLRTSFGFSPWSALKKHYGGWNADESKLYDKYFTLASEHRIDLHKIYIQFPKLGEGADLLSAGPPQKSFLELWNKMTSGDLSPNGYRWSTTDLPVPDTVKSPNTASESERAELEKYWKALDRAVTDNKLEKSTFVYFVDEPKPPTYPKLISSMKMIRKWAPDLQFLVTLHRLPQFEGVFNLWCPNLIQWDQPSFPSPTSYEQHQVKTGERFWLYTACDAHGCGVPRDVHLPDLVIDRPAAYQRVFAYYALRYHASGILYYQSDFGYDTSPESPWKDDFSFGGYGEGNLFYPCTPALCGTEGHEALPSLRLKALRDGLQDAQLLTMARAKGAPVDKWLKELIPNVRAFPVDTQAYEKLKIKALEALEPR